MQAIVKKYARPGLWIDEVSEPQVGINDVLIRVLKSSICGTDVHIYNWDSWAQKTIPVPMVVGHEYVGVIETVGSNVQDFKPGDLVTGEGHLVCGRCRNCLAGRRHLCKETLGVGIDRPGAFARYVAIPMSNVWHCDPTIPLDVLSCFDPLGNAVHTALSFDLLGEDVLICGAGPIGIMAAAIAKHAGARYVVITDINLDRLKLAQTVHPTLAVDVTQTRLSEVVKELGMKEGFDVGLEMSGSPEALNELMTVMCHGGKIAMLGLQPAGTAVDWDLVVFNGLTIKGIYGREMYETWYKMTMLIETGLDIMPLITDRLDYEDFETGFQLMRSGRAGKVILDWR